MISKCNEIIIMIQMRNTRIELNKPIPTEDRCERVQVEMCSSIQNHVSNRSNELN
jgi:hypothetical protein